MKRIILTLGLIALFSCSKDKATEKINNEDIVKLQINNRLAYPAYKKDN